MILMDEAVYFLMSQKQEEHAWFLLPYNSDGKQR